MVIDAQVLQRWINEQRPFTLIDVLPEEYFIAQRLPGAKRACVYEVTFLDQIKAHNIGPNDPLVIYGAGDNSHDSKVAAEKLARAGFRQVYEFRGGRTAWAELGGKFEGDGVPAPGPATPEDKTYIINSEKSTVEWIGRSLTSTHRGTLRIKSGQLILSSGEFTAGEVLLDMRSLRSTDLEIPEMREMLDAHLKSGDFFEVDRYPDAVLKLVSATSLPNEAPGSPNYEISGDLTIKEITRSIDFPAIVALTAEGVLTAVAQIEIDRTQWNVIYGSGRFFKMLGKHLVNDAITLLVKIVAE